ncbi:hypothetical protein ACH42_17330 [Endozoicomonas sp. (ex Bugula neritina AB1)]|nr:hypothetical protein ACH42_17330 [Endozoicomonas sp. (ex Bugula neritina AB1)]
MKVSKIEYQVTQKALQHWHQSQVIDDNQFQQMKNSLELKPFDWQLLARLAFWGGVGCLVFSFLIILSDEALLQLLARLFDTPPIVKFLFFSTAAILLWSLGFVVRKKKPARRLSYDPIFFLGVACVGVALLFLDDVFGFGSEHELWLFLLAAMIYLLAGWVIQSPLIWGCALLVAGVWFGLETTSYSGRDEFFAGMNFPVRYIPFGIAIYMASYAIRSRFSSAYLLTRLIGLSYFFIALWLATFYGNESWMNDYDRFEFLSWELAGIAICLLTIGYGAKSNDNLLREFGIVFLLINIYSRYFDYYLDEIHAALFFMILAASLWLVGKYAERLWLLGK